MHVHVYIETCMHSCIYQYVNTYVNTVTDIHMHKRVTNANTNTYQVDVTG